ncbi:MAG: hypothetical protein V7697_29055 [Rhodococcus erythropolis]
MALVLSVPQEGITPSGHPSATPSKMASWAELIGSECATVPVPNLKSYRALS